MQGYRSDRFMLGLLTWTMIEGNLPDTAPAGYPPREWLSGRSQKLKKGQELDD